MKKELTVERSALSVERNFKTVRSSPSTLNSQLSTLNEKNVLLPVLFLVLTAVFPGSAAAFDYPTIDRVEYVHACMRDNPGQTQVMVYKCSCVIDAIAKKMSYDEFVESSTAANAFTIGGERGETVRNSAPTKKMADKFKEIQSKAKKGCFIE